MEKKIIKNYNQISKYLHFGIKKKEARVDATPAAFWWLPLGGCLRVAAFADFKRHRRCLLKIADFELNITSSKSAKAQKSAKIN